MVYGREEAFKPQPPITAVSHPDFQENLKNGVVAREYFARVANLPARWGVLSLPDQLEYICQTGSFIALKHYQFDGDTFVDLTTIHIPVELRGRGIGTALLRALCFIADSTGWTITTTAEPIGNRYTNAQKARLERWYKAHGFVNATGRKGVYGVSGALIRHPVGWAR